MNNAQRQGEGSSGAAWGMAVLFALILGALQRDVGALLAGGAIGWLFARVADLQKQVRRLAQRPAGAAAAAEPAEHRETAPAAETPAQPVAEAPRRPGTASPPQAPGEPYAPEPVSVEPPRAAPAPRGPSAFDRLVARAWDWLRGGNPLARAGIVILFFGAAYLAKYAAERTVVPLELRFALIAAGAVGLLVLGWRLRARRRVYAHILQGGGIAGLYLTVFAASRLYELLPMSFALGLMVVVAIASAVLAVAQSALPLAVIGTAGGFLAPILVSTGGGNHIALFSYYTVLNLGVFAVAWFRAWRVLNLIGFVFTFGVAGLFRATSYDTDKLLGTDGFLILFFLMYVAISVLFALRQKPDLRGYVSGTLVFGLPVAAFTLHATLVAHIEYALAWSALALGAFYLLLAALLLRRGDANLRLLAEAFAALGVIFGSLAVPLGFDTQTTAAMWAVEGAGLLWLGIRQDRVLARLFGLLLQVLAGGAYLLGLHALDATTPVLNSPYLGTVMIALSGGLSAWWLARGRGALRPYEQGFEIMLAVWAAIWWVGGGVAEIHRAWPQYSLGAVLVFFAFSAAAFEHIGARGAWALARRIALALLAPACAIGLLQAVELGHPSVRAGAAGWLLLLAAAYRLLHRLDRAPDTALAAVVPVCHALAAWLFALLVAWEAAWQVAQQLGGVWRHLPWALVPAALLWVLGARTLRPAWPLAAHERTYRGLAAQPLALFASAWIVAINLVSDGDAGPIAYLPLLNPLDLSVALTLAALARYAVAAGALDAQRFSDDNRRVLYAAAAALVFLWLNAALLRALHHGVGTPLELHGMLRSVVVQASLSVFWGLLGFGAMVLASRRGLRVLWIVGATLMAVVVFKLFLIDTAGRGTLARIVSFLTVGALLLVTGYLSPLPPPRREEQTA